MPHEFLSESLPSASRSVRRGTGDKSRWAIHQRLCIAERELRVQFTRIAQLQAQLDLLLGALRRSPDGTQALSVSAGRAAVTLDQPARRGHGSSSGLL